MEHTYNSLFFVALAALLSPWISIRLLKSWIPAVIIEIVLGFLIGPHALHIAKTTVDIDFLASFGFSYLMFLSGLELDFDLMASRSDGASKPPWVRGALFFAVTLLISYGLASILHHFGFIENVLVVTLILSTTSVGIVTPTLKESGWIRAAFGQEVMLYALIADICTLILFTAYIAFHSTGNAFSILLVLVIILIFVLLYRILRLASRFRFIRVVETATSEIGLRGSFALILAFLALSKILGTEVVIGAFLAGATISLLSDKHSHFNKKLNSIGYGFLLPIFFVNVGMTFDLQSLAASPAFWIVMGVSLVGMYLNKLAPAQFFLRKFSGKQRMAGGLLLSSRLSLLIAASQIASQTGILSESMKNGFILLAIVTCLLSPIFFSKSIRGIEPPEESTHQTSVITIEKSTLPSGWILDQIEVRSRNAYDMELRQLNLPLDLLFVSIQRDDERIIPRGRTRLEPFDVVQVMGDPGAVSAARHLLEHGKE